MKKHTYTEEREKRHASTGRKPPPFLHRLEFYAGEIHRRQRSHQNTCREQGHYHRTTIFKACPSFFVFQVSESIHRLFEISSNTVHHKHKRRSITQIQITIPQRSSIVHRRDLIRYFQTNESKVQKHPTIANKAKFQRDKHLRLQSNKRRHGCSREPATQSIESLHPWGHKLATTEL
ncbi:unnamed protein product [Brassica oleracea var. botrytis]